jgi:hypothetical protein
VGTPDLTNKTILKVLLSEIISTKEFHLSGKLKIFKVAILKKIQNIVKKKVLCSAEKGSVIWAEPNSRCSAEQFCQTKRSVSHYIAGICFKM